MSHSSADTARSAINHFTDWHCHILPSLDDGPATVGEALEIGRALHYLGFASIYCTPHCIKGVYEADVVTIGRAVTRLQHEFDQAGLPLTLLAGREYYLDEFLPAMLADPGLREDSPFLLVEIPGRAQPDYVEKTVAQLLLNKRVPLIAHPERCELLAPESLHTWLALKWLPQICGARSAGTSGAESALDSAAGYHNPLLSRLVKMGCRFQGNIGSFVGLYGERVRFRALHFLESGLYDRLGSDAHSSRHLGEWLQKGVREIERVAGRDALSELLGGQPLI